MPAGCSLTTLHSQVMPVCMHACVHACTPADSCRGHLHLYIIYSYIDIYLWLADTSLTVPCPLVK